MKPNPKRNDALREQGEVGKTNDTAPKVVEHPEAAKQNESDKRDHSPIQDLFPESLSQVMTASRSIPPIVSGQCAEVLELIRKHQPILSFEITATYAIPECAARVHDLRALGFDVRTRIEPKVIFRGRERRNAAFYSLGAPEWPAPGFASGGVAQ